MPSATRAAQAPQITMSVDFLAALGKLPPKVSNQVRDQLVIFQQNPRHPSLNYETIKHAGDARMRSLRVSSNYRIILAHPDGSGVYILLWVDTHDAAYTWAERHRLDDGAEGLGLAILPTREDDAPPLAYTPFAITIPQHSNLLPKVSDDELLTAGIPELLLLTLRACADEDALLGLLGALRTEVAEAVLFLALGERPSAQQETSPADRADEVDVGSKRNASMVEASVSTPPIAPQAATTDNDNDNGNARDDALATALARPASGRRFVQINSLRDLEQALDYPLERWRLFLHPDQRAVVTRHFSGPALVSGAAGTGKSVVGLHRAYHLASHVFTSPTDRILLTTFTRNLAQNLSALMNSLCGDDATTANRIEVTHVHSLAVKLRRLAGETVAIAPTDMENRLLLEATRQHDTLGLPASFYHAEWMEVVQEREALDEAAYLQVERTGRGKPLNRRQRAAVWPVLAAYRDALQAARYEDWPTSVWRARELITSGRLALPYTYRAVIVDEAQDMGAPEMRLLLALAGTGPDSLLLLGDSRQQIYARGSYVPLLGVPIGRRHARLRVNYRTTEQISQFAAQTLHTAAALTGEPLDANDAISLLSGPPPERHAFPDDAAEQRAVVAAIQAALGGQAPLEPQEIAVIARTKALAQRFYQALAAAGVPATLLDAENPAPTGVQVGPIHRVKGLEFRVVYLVACSANSVPQPFRGEESEAAHADHEERERRLLYVAMTRARDALWVSGSAPMSPFLSFDEVEIGLGQPCA